MKVIVITPTTGKPSLQRAIDSIKAQTMPCQHWVINDGKMDFSCDAEVVINLPENTGRANENATVEGFRKMLRKLACVTASIARI